MKSESQNNNTHFYQKSLLLEPLAYGYSMLRTVHFAAQGIMLPLIDKYVLKNKDSSPKDYPQHLSRALPKIQNLLQKDSQNIANGLYPLEVLKPENVIEHTFRYPLIIKEAFSAGIRKTKNLAHEFDSESQELLNELPEYYQRNFHFQPSGYLGETSANLYEHQVEILFSGAADAMRRLILSPLKTHFNNSDGEGLHFLEIASGTGRLTRFVKLAFPKAKITCLELSPTYLKKSQENLNQFNFINFIQGSGETIPCKDSQFDAVYSCFLFHELPLDIRIKVLEESSRVVKNNGFIGLVDSLQKNDDPEFNWALEKFPVDFHEPFYKNYTLKPMLDLFSQIGFGKVKQEVGFLSKVVWGTKL